MANGVVRSTARRVRLRASPAEDAGVGGGLLDRPQGGVPGDHGGGGGGLVGGDQGQAGAPPGHTGRQGLYRRAVIGRIGHHVDGPSGELPGQQGDQRRTRGQRARRIGRRVGSGDEAARATGCSHAPRPACPAGRSIRSSRASSRRADLTAGGRIRTCTASSGRPRRYHRLCRDGAESARVAMARSCRSRVRSAVARNPAIPPTPASGHDVAAGGPGPGSGGGG